MADTSALNSETSHFIVGTSASNASVDVGSYHHDFGTSRNPIVPQSFHNNLTQTARGVHSTFSQRSTPPFRTSSSLRLGHVAPSDDGLQMVAESYPSRHPRPLTTIGWRNGDRNGRSRISSDRHRPLADAASLHDRFSSEVSLSILGNYYYYYLGHNCGKDGSVQLGLPISMFSRKY